MACLLLLIWSAITGRFRSRTSLEAEILVLRQRFNVLRRKMPMRLAFNKPDCFIFLVLFRLSPGILDRLAIVQLKTVLCWRRGRRPKLPAEVRSLIRDNDGIFGAIFTRRLYSMGIRDRPTAPRSPWRNGYAERLIGSIRRQCLDHVVIFGERHLRYFLRVYKNYYNNARRHLSLTKNSPISRAAEAIGRVISTRSRADYTIATPGYSLR